MDWPLAAVLCCLIVSVATVVCQLIDAPAIDAGSAPRHTLSPPPRIDSGIYPPPRPNRG